MSFELEMTRYTQFNLCDFHFEFLFCADFLQPRPAVSQLEICLPCLIPGPYSQLWDSAQGWGARDSDWCGCYSEFLHLLPQCCIWL